MRLTDIVEREMAPEPWAEGEKIPWNEPGFSRRMLREHLSQDHDAASRRETIIDGHVRWIHEELLDRRQTSVLDLACGPGFYTSRLSRLGHACTGIDFGPASIEHARAEAEQCGLACDYVLGDIRTTDFGRDHGLVMLLFGELNVFRPDEARDILRRARSALGTSGILLIEPHTYEAVRRAGNQPASWYSSASGLFSDRPHICLEESFWHEEPAVAVQRYFVIDCSSGEVTRHSASMQAYSNDEYREVLRDCGFAGVRLGVSPPDSDDTTREALLFIVASAQ